MARWGPLPKRADSLSPLQTRWCLAVFSVGLCVLRAWARVKLLAAAQLESGNQALRARTPRPSHRVCRLALGRPQATGRPFSQASSPSAVARGQNTFEGRPGAMSLFRSSQLPAPGRGTGPDCRAARPLHSTPRPLPAPRLQGRSIAFRDRQHGRQALRERGSQRLPQAQGSALAPGGMLAGACI